MSFSTNVTFRLNSNPAIKNKLNEHHGVIKNDCTQQQQQQHYNKKSSGEKVLQETFVEP
jgi:hypothetical protein